MNIYLKEIIDAHKLIVTWLGSNNNSKDIYKDLISRFCDKYSMVTPNGTILDYNLLKQFFCSQEGSKKGLKIDITDMKIISQHHTGATVVYIEKQTLPLKESTVRYATVVFEINDENKVIWKHLHETFLK